MTWNKIFENELEDAVDEGMTKSAIKIGKHVGQNKTIFKAADNDIVDAIRNNVGRPLRHGIENASEFIGDHPIASVAAAVAAGLGGLALRNKLKKMKEKREMEAEEGPEID